MQRRSRRVVGGEGLTGRSTFSVQATVSNLKTGQSVALDMLVDTTRPLSVIPALILSSIGVEPRERELVELVHGAWLTIDQGEVAITLEGVDEMRVPALCIFGPQQEPPVLGRLVLDTLSLEVDEEHQRLVPVVRRWIEHG